MTDTLREPAFVRALGRSAVVARHFYRVGSPHFPVGTVPLRIAHVTDLHIGRMTPEARLQMALDAVNALEPDVICLTGDYVAHSLEYLPRLTHLLRSVRVPTFATLGNHDHWHGADAVRRALEHANVRVLSNETTVFEHAGQRWNIVGIDDAVTGHHDVGRAFEGVEAGAPVLALSHLAELAGALAHRGAALVLSGHTHGGQIHTGGVMERFMRRLGHRYILGWYHVGDVPVYVNRGIGAAVFPWRTHPAAAEVAGIELGPAPQLTIEESPRVVRWPPRSGSEMQIQDDKS